MTGVNLNNVIKKYGETQVIHGVDLQIEDGEFCVFVGPSGCGKSTLLRMIAGLEETTGGSMSIGDRDVTDMDPSQRGVAMVFQTYALYPHMTVEENMGFGLKMNGVPKTIVKEKSAKPPTFSSWVTTLSASPRHCLAVNDSALRLGAQLCVVLKSFYLMSRFQIWMLSCVWKCAWKSHACTTKLARR